MLLYAIETSISGLRLIEMLNYTDHSLGTQALKWFEGCSGDGVESGWSRLWIFKYIFEISNKPSVLKGHNHSLIVHHCPLSNLFSSFWKLQFGTVRVQKLHIEVWTLWPLEIELHIFLQKLKSKYMSEIWKYLFGILWVQTESTSWMLSIMNLSETVNVHSPRISSFKPLI